MLLSVVIPSFNEAASLEKSVEIVATQSLRPDEILVVDDGSTDDSHNIFKKLTSRYPQLKIIHHEKNKGIVAALNTGLQHVCGEYVYCGSINDPILPGFFERAIAMLKQYPQSGVFCSNFYEKDCRTGDLRLITPPLPQQPHYYTPDEWKYFLNRSMSFCLPTCTVIAKREWLHQAGDFLPQMKWHSDWFLLHTLAARHGFCYHPEPGATFSTDTQSYTHKHASNIFKRRKVASSFLKLLRSSSFKDVKPYFQYPALLALPYNGKWNIREKMILNPLNWSLLSWKLIRNSLRDTFRRRLWKWTWMLIFPLGIRYFNNLKIQILKCFGASIQGSPRIHSSVLIECPWNLKLEDGVILSQGVELWAKAGIEIKAHAILEKKVVLYTTCWQLENSTRILKSLPIKIGANVLIPPHAVIMPGSDIKASS